MKLSELDRYIVEDAENRTLYETLFRWNFIKEYYTPMYKTISTSGCFNDKHWGTHPCECEEAGYKEKLELAKNGFKVVAMRNWGFVWYNGATKVEEYHRFGR